MELGRSMVEQSSVPLWNLWQFDLEEKAIFTCISGFVWGKWFTLEKEKGISQIEMFLLVLIAKERKEHNVRQFLWISLVLRSLRKVPCALFSFFSKNRNFPLSPCIFTFFFSAPLYPNFCWLLFFSLHILSHSPLSSKQSCSEIARGIFFNVVEEKLSFFSSTSSTLFVIQVALKIFSFGFRIWWLFCCFLWSAIFVPFSSSCSVHVWCILKS